MRTGMQSPLVRAVLRYVEDHFAEPISLRDVAQALGCAPAHLTHTFSRRVGVPVNAWMTRRRMTAAKELLLHTNADVAAACEAVGFNDQCYFTRQFIRHVGSVAAIIGREGWNAQITAAEQGGPATAPRLTIDAAMLLIDEALRAAGSSQACTRDEAQAAFAYLTSPAVGAVTIHDDAIVIVTATADRPGPTTP